MKKMYYISTKERLNGDHLVHSENCPFLSENKDMILLGSFKSVSEAIIEGTSCFRKVEKCPFCSRSHKNEDSCITGLKDMEVLFVSAVPDHNDYDFMICCTN
jgi:hypothetical protein